MDEILKLQSIIFNLIKREVKLDPHHKSYEGAIEVELPGLYQIGVSLTLHCYVAEMGGTHHEYNGATLDECLDKLRLDLVMWEQALKDREAGCE